MTMWIMCKDVYHSVISYSKKMSNSRELLICDTLNTVAHCKPLNAYKELMTAF